MDKISKTCEIKKDKIDTKYKIGKTCKISN
jgi:hypothetical protein